MPAATQSRAKAAVLGALVADAATMGLHWIYDPAKLAATLAEGGRSAGSCEFFEPPACPFYSNQPGNLSPYGDELLPVLTYLAQTGAMDGPGFAQHLAAYYRSYSGPYLNHSSKSLLANVEAGAAYPLCGDEKDTQANAFVKVPAIVARYAGRPELGAAVEAAVRTQQRSDYAVAVGLAAARILERVVAGASVEEAVAWAAAPGSLAPDMTPLVAAALEARGAPLGDAIKAFGASCAMPGAFQNALVAALQAGSYEGGVRANIAAGGDNCSRAVLVGALLGAQAGGVPAAWATKTNRFAEFEALADKVVAAP